MLGQLAPQKPGEREAVVAAGLDIGRILTARDLVQSDDVFFAATGITDGLLMPGVRYTSDGATTDSMVMRGRSGTRRTIHAEHRQDKVMTFSSFDLAQVAR
jgi:fructose-1,6-bisphosphatase II